jgi:hypothetical protein
MLKFLQYKCVNKQTRWVRVRRVFKVRNFRTRTSEKSADSDLDVWKALIIGDGPLNTGVVQCMGSIPHDVSINNKLFPWSADTHVIWVARNKVTRPQTILKLWPPSRWGLDFEVRGRGAEVGNINFFWYYYPVHLLVIPMYICSSQFLFSHSYVVNEWLNRHCNVQINIWIRADELGIYPINIMAQTVIYYHVYIISKKSDIW